MTGISGKFRVGTSGYQYPHWRGVFYPVDLPRRRWFAYYADRFDTVEINNTFYRLPGPRVFDGWRSQAPEDFRYALKYNRYATHIKHLKNPQKPLRRFWNCAVRLGETLGPVLVQLPPHWRVNVERLAEFAAQLPCDSRWAIEVRDASWLCENVFAVLNEYNIALCIHDMLAGHPRVFTADFVYLRFHGDRYRGCYSHQFLTAQAALIATYLGNGLDTYAYFNNDERAYAVANALDLKRYLTRRRGAL